MLIGNIKLMKTFKTAFMFETHFKEPMQRIQFLYFIFFYVFQKTVFDALLSFYSTPLLSPSSSWVWHCVSNPVLGCILAVLG